MKQLIFAFTKKYECVRRLKVPSIRIYKDDVDIKVKNHGIGKVELATMQIEKKTRK